MKPTLAAAAVLTLVSISSLPATAGEEPGVYHRYMMRGAIIEADESGVYLCVGTSDGAKKGQVLDVWRVSRGTSAPAKTGPRRFKREKVGTVEILEVVDEHFANAKRVSGEAQKGDLVELEAPSG